MTFNEKLKLVASKIKSAHDFMGSHWNNAEAETVALQTIIACANNLKNYGDAFSWQGSNTLKTGGGRLVDNPRGVSILLESGDLVLESYDNPMQLEVPNDVVISSDRKPMVFRCTEKLLNYAIEFIK